MSVQPFVNRSRRFFAPILLVVSCLVFGAVISDANSEKVKTKRKAKIFSDKGEQSRVITSAKAGESLLVLRKEGRWYKVRINGRTGWITRSNLAVSTERKSSSGRRVAFVEGRDRQDGNAKAPEDRAGIDTVANSEKFEEPERKSRDFEEPDDLEGLKEEKPTVMSQRSVVVRVSETDLFAKPNEASEFISQVKKGDSFPILKERKKWFLVEHPKDGKGWIYYLDVKVNEAVVISEDRDDDGGGVTLGERFDDEPDIDMGGSLGAYRYPKKSYSAFANLGIVSLSQAFASDSQMAIGNYAVSANSVAIGFGGDFLYEHKEKLLLGADIKIAYGKSIPGIKFQVNNVQETIGFSNLKINLMGKVGVNLAKKFKLSNGLAAYGRFGLFYDQMNVDRSTGDDLNGALIPTEVLAGPRLGLSVVAPRISSGQIARKISVRGYLDFMLPFLFTSRAQTQGLEDGASSSASAIFFGLEGDYAFRENLSFTADYQYYRASTSWSGISPRTGANNASRVDSSNTLVFGALMKF